MAAPLSFSPDFFLPPQSLFPSPRDKSRPPCTVLDLYRQAERALSRLELAAEMVPSLEWFVYAFVRKEAVLSSQIEGTQATLVDLLSHEVQRTRQNLSDDVEEVCNYLEALTYAREELARPDGLPLSLRLLDQTHARLRRGVRGTHKQPGSPRRSQNWIGGTRPSTAMYVPPPPHRLGEVLSDFERYMHVGEEDRLPSLVRAGLLHVQFESIHPYLDGNGRLGRLLITLLLEHHGLLSEPILYLSLFFKRHRQLYYERLNAVRTHGDWEGWLAFFLEGVATIAEESIASSRALFLLVNQDRQRLLEHPQMNLFALRVFESLPTHPIVTSAWLRAHFESSKPRVTRALDLLEEVGVLVETTGMQRDRVYAYDAYLACLRDEGSAPRKHDTRQLSQDEESRELPGQETSRCDSCPGSSRLSS